MSREQLSLFLDTAIVVEARYYSFLLLLARTGVRLGSPTMRAAIRSFVSYFLHGAGSKAGRPTRVCDVSAFLVRHERVPSSQTSDVSLKKPALSLLSRPVGCDGLVGYVRLVAQGRGVK